MFSRKLLALLLFCCGLSAGWLFADETAVAPTPNAGAINLYRAGKLSEARASFEKITAAEPNNAEAYFYLGQLALIRKDAEQAVRCLETATRLAPRNSPYVRMLGDGYGLAAQQAGLFSKYGLAKKCLAAFDQAVALDPGNIDARISRIGYYRQAPGIAGGGMDKAYAEAAEIRRRDPLRGAQALGDLYIAEKKYTEAFALLDEVIAKDPDNKALLYQVGRLAAITGQQLDRGEAALKDYLQHSPAPGEPPLYNAHWRLGTLYERKGDKAAARAAYEAALKMNPDYDRARDALKKLN